MNRESPNAPLAVNASVSLPPVGPKAKLPSQRLKQWLGMAVLHGLLEIVLAIVLLNERQHRLAQKQDRLAVQARVIEENLERQLQGVNAALSNLRYDLISAGKSEATNKVALNLRALAAAMPGVGNRRHFDQSLATQWATAHRQQSPLALLMLDIDHFKLYNDAYGPQGGDDCLRQVAGLLSALIVRTGEVLARYGGEEFAILLPHTATCEPPRPWPSAAYSVSQSFVK